jgi:hypothetical protein
VRYLVAALCLPLVASGCGGDGKPAATSTVITVSGPYRYPQKVIDSFMSSCTHGTPAREKLCACVIDKLSYSVSNRDFARILRDDQAVPRVKRAARRATAACA